MWHWFLADNPISPTVSSQPQPCLLHQVNSQKTKGASGRYLEEEAYKGQTDTRTRLKRSDMARTVVIHSVTRSYLGPRISNQFKSCESNCSNWNRIQMLCFDAIMPWSAGQHLDVSPASSQKFCWWPAHQCQHVARWCGHQEKERDCSWHVASHWQCGTKYQV